nr:MAG: hypothetical protein [Microvirus sp.]
MDEIDKLQKALEIMLKYEKKTILDILYDLGKKEFENDLNLKLCQ